MIAGDTDEDAINGFSSHPLSIFQGLGNILNRFIDIDNIALANAVGINNTYPYNIQGSAFGLHFRNHGPNLRSTNVDTSDKLIFCQVGWKNKFFSQNRV